MNVITRHSDGSVREYELTHDETIVKELYELMLDQGLSPMRAVNVITGAAVAPGLRSPTPALDAIMADKDFRRLLDTT